MRDSFLDSSKALLIFCVVLGHFLERLIGWSDPKSHVFLGVIYTIHMPAFIFISGMLFKDKNVLKNILFFIALYVPFQIIYPLFDSLWTANLVWNWNLFERPYWILWYLLGMMVWTLLTHYLIRTKIPFVIAIGFAVLIGFSSWNNYQYSVGRIMVFLPFFIMGHLYGKQMIQWIRQQKYQVFKAISILIFIAGVMSFTKLSAYWLYGSLSYQQLKVGWIEGSLTRIGCLLLSTLGLYAVFVLSSKLKSGFRSLGERTLSVYLLHGFVVIAISNVMSLNGLSIYFAPLNFSSFNFAGFNFSSIYIFWSIKVALCLALSILSCWILQQALFDQLLRTLSLWLVKPTEKFWKK